MSITKKQFVELLPKLRLIRAKGHTIMCDKNKCNGAVVAVPTNESTIYVATGEPSDMNVIGLSHKDFYSVYEFNYSFYVEYKKTIGEIKLEDLL